MLHDEGLDDYVVPGPALRRAEPAELGAWRDLVSTGGGGDDRAVRIGLVGKYVNLPDAYLSVVEALKHGGYAHGAKVEIDWIQAEDVEGLLAEGRLHDLDGIVIPGGFGDRGIEGKIAAAAYAREHDIPFLGLCLGLQAMVIEFARNVVGLAGANSAEFDHATPHPVIDLMDDQREVVDKGGTMRLGAYPAVLPGSTGRRDAYGTEVVYERHRHRYEFNPRYRRRLEDAGLLLRRHVARRPAGRVHRAARPPVLGRHAGPPRVQEPAQPSAPAVPRAGRAALARAEGRTPRCRSPTSGGRRPRRFRQARVERPPRRRSRDRPGRRS